MTHVLVDLDGVLYRGRTPIDGSSRGLSLLSGAGFELLFITNNSTKTPQEVAHKISTVTGQETSPGDVLTSAMAATRLLETTDRAVMVIGEGGIEDSVRATGKTVTTSWQDADAVIVGLDRDLSYDKLELATRAIREGAKFIATNLDPTYPSESGLLPGSGSVVAAVAAATGITPLVAGKPSATMIELIRSRGVGKAYVIGDRVDTDVALAAEQPDWTTLLVLTGVTSPEEAENSLADHVVADFSAAAEMVIRHSDGP